jgi:hypothetical protein
MKLKALSVFFFAAATASLAMACSSADAGDESHGDSDNVNEQDATTAKVTPGSFKLYSKPHTVPSAGCDVHTALDLKADVYSTASLQESVGGLCQLAVMPNPRTYRLRLASTDCGTRVYTGSITKNGNPWSIKITDNRARTCENVIAAAVIVEETEPGFPGPITTTKYSMDASPAPAQVTLEGTLTRTFGIGGENTGRSIATASGMVELILDAGEQNQFVAGKKARAKGVSKLLSGVETHDRKALEVSELLVCPDAGHIDCMPGPNVRLSNLCAGDNRSWIQANCAGVQFTD